LPTENLFALKVVESTVTLKTPFLKKTWKVVVVYCNLAE